MVYRRSFLTFASVIGTLVPAEAHADVVWPALILEPRLLSIPVIGLGMLLEAGMLRFAFHLSWFKSIFGSALVNGISAALGIILIPLAGVVWEIIPGLLLYKIFRVGTFNPFTWAGTFFLATVVTTAVEVTCLRMIFKLPLNRRTWGLWFIANAASVGLAFGSLIIHPVDYASGDAYRVWLIR